MAELATRKWADAQRCSIQVKLSTIRNIKTDVARSFPAVRLLKAACEQQQMELHRVESEWKRRTGSAANLGVDSEEPHFCLGLESRFSDSSKLSDAEPLNRLSQLEQALIIWAGQHFNGALFSLSTGVGTGMRTLRIGERIISPAGPSSHEACLYAGMVRDSDSLDTVSRYSKLHDVPTIMILAAHLAVTDSHSSGPLLEWPLPPIPRDRATGAYSSEKIQELNASAAPARLTLLHSSRMVDVGSLTAPSAFYRDGWCGGQGCSLTTPTRAMNLSLTRIKLLICSILLKCSALHRAARGGGPKSTLLKVRPSIQV